MSGVAERHRTEAGGAQPRTHAEEVNPHKLHRLGGYIALDGRVSWAPKEPGRYQPVSCYVVREGQQAYLLDTGVAGHRKQVVEQITELLPRGIPLTGFLTRTEYQCVGNLGAIFKARGMEELVSGGRNPFAAYEDVARDLKDSVRRTVLTIGRSKAEPLGSSKTMVVIPPLIRVLSTNWVYDAGQKVLFTSDMFSHTSVASPPDGAIIDSLERDRTTFESARSHILCRYFWLPQATTAPLSNWLEKVFKEYDVETIAPTFGCVLKGRVIVRKHYDLMMELLERLGRKD